MAAAETESIGISYRYLPGLLRLRWPRSFAFTISGFQGDHILESIKRTGRFYESDLLEELALRLPSRPGVILDVGANIGNHTLYFARVLAQRVIAIEPHGSAAALLENNIRTNGTSDQVVVVRAGASDRQGRAFIVQGEQSNNLGSTRLSASKIPSPDPSHPTEDVPVLTVDDISYLYAGSHPIHLIKIDVEGMEAHVLKGAMRTITKHLPLITLEANTKEDIHITDELLIPLGYTRIGPFAWTPTYIYLHRHCANLMGTLCSHIMRFARRVLRSPARRLAPCSA
jgi:FkbM family methyltransferase